MKDAVLLELAARWERDAKAPQCEDGAEAARLSNAKQAGNREGRRECADALRMLVALLGEAPE
jgi:hypothetical protein